MKDVVLDEDRFIEEIVKKYGQSKKFIVFLIKICKDFNIVNYENEIKNFIGKICK